MKVFSRIKMLPMLICSKIHIRRMVKQMGAYEIMKKTLTEAMDILRKSDNLELYQMIFDSYNAAIDLMLENRDLHIEVQNLEQKIKELEELKKKEDSITIHDEVYYIIDKDDNEQGPYCTRCWDIDKNLVRLKLHHSTEKQKVFKCPHCDTTHRVDK